MATIPAVMFLEMAMDVLKSQDSGILTAETKECRMLGEGRIAEIRQTLPDNSDFERGYLLGLEVARTLLNGRPDAVQAGVQL